MFAKVLKTIKKYGMIDPGERVGVAVSGGSDSVALLTVLHDLVPRGGFSLVVVHVHHGLRGAESDRDADFVKTLADGLGLPLATGTIPPGTLSDGGGASLEDRARRERYRIFDEIGKLHGLTKMALGHTLDDQAETVLMKFLRGAGAAGLRGMLPVRDGFFIRPLLETTRREIQEFLDKRGILYVTDSTNEDDCYLRNRIRRRVLPELAELVNPNLAETLERTAEIFRDEEDWLKEMTNSAADRLGLRFDRVPVEIDLAKLRDCNRALQRRLIKLCLNSVPVGGPERGFEHVEAVLSLVEGDNPSGRLDLGGGLEARREYDRLVVGRRPEPDETTVGTSFSCVARCPGVTPIDAIARSLSLEMVDKAGAGTAGIAFMDMDTIDGLLTVRNVLPGDRIQPLGMKGHKKLKSLFIDAKVPRRLRCRIPLLADARSIIWVPGICLSERVRVRKETRAVMKAEIV
ncbi:MAG TPA: tRNA lysidine(34) synthetase TilS [Deltaproteobacteria bacterium]|nr:tRNA lysidine(34) synthetase TilS [Deltaproteobacteria bacterium]